jgi:hypothetical protein
MTKTFFANSKHQGAINAFQVAVPKLSLEGYNVLQVSSKHGNHIEIDRAYEGVEPKVSWVADKMFGSIELYGCRVYWRIE